MKPGLPDGYLGLIVAMASASSVFWEYAKIWELKTQNNPPVEKAD